ncbi:hypothetical protein BJ741DRAFT_582108 [Chytriomyces cf. hyalinus JEL632]|nr:hypothetical protein BJ741DRAFT_582108 [Chytriomyces cf. hyalinus JEL632]
MGSTSGSGWDEGFQDWNDSDDDGTGNQDYETGNNADDKFNLEEALDEPWDLNNTNSAFDAYTMSLSKRVKVGRKTWAARRKQQVLAWESNCSANVLDMMEGNWPGVDRKSCGVNSCPNPAAITCKTCCLQNNPCQFLLPPSYAVLATFLLLPTNQFSSLAAAFSFEILEITLKFQNEKSNKVSNYGAAMALFNHHQSSYMNKVCHTACPCSGKDADTKNNSDAISNQLKPPRIFANDSNFQMKHKSLAFGEVAVTFHQVYTTVSFCGG